MITNATLTFLKGLKRNNNRDWFQAHRKEYENARQNFLDLVAILLHRMVAFDESLLATEPEECLFRIHRDLRFSKDKTPYKPWFGASLKPGGRRGSGAGYYIHIAPGNSFAGGGVYHPSREELERIRERIAEKPKQWESIVTEKNFVAAFGEIGGEKLKTAPRGYSQDHPQIRWLRHKDFIVGEQLPDPLVQSPKVLDRILEDYRRMVPFKDFMNAAMGVQF
jgi:uncharacterized protein (TIGR02453 family)